MIAFLCTAFGYMLGYQVGKTDGYLDAWTHFTKGLATGMARRVG